MGIKHIWEGDDGDNTITGTNFSKDIIYGLGGDDNLDGGAQSDTLIGGLGKDRLYGGLGRDVFEFDSTAESTVANPDLIRDLHENQDRIDLSNIDADTTVEGDQAFHIVSSFTGQAGELTLTFVKALHATLVQGDVDGDGSADFAIQLHGHHADFTGFDL